MHSRFLQPAHKIMSVLPAVGAGAVQPVPGQPGSAASEPLPLPAAAAGVPGSGPHPLLQNALLEAAALQSLLQICRHSTFHAGPCRDHSQARSLP